ncbi:germ cell nuclear acidic protein [Bicyclus anynana]|uniref:Germ cell nuclear acidic protein n=1 Tax=Bicyclus anynana TaxID=110368 RepID=A0A6J1NZE5_BICAN|nr:germ cell nuclear acidic protein [Bicyclus anynana]
MDIKQGQRQPQNRLLKLSLKKNRVKTDQEPKKPNRSSDIMIIDESFDKLISDYQKTLTSNRKIYSPIVINDSLDTSEDEIIKNKEPSKSGNVSATSIKDFTSPINNGNGRPSIGGWSPGQSIICATPKTKPVPTTPKDKADESLEHCSIKKIQQSHHKLLSELYGEKWKSIPSLFKTKQCTDQYDGSCGISKKLQFDDDESDKENIRDFIKQTKELYLTGSDFKNRKGDFSNTEGRSRKKLYTEKVPNTPELPKQKPKLKTDNNLSTPETTKQKKININRDVKTTIKKRKDMTVTELVRAMENDVDVLTKKVQNVTVTPSKDVVKRLSFVGSLADNVPTWRCHPEALQYHDSFKTLKEQLSRRLFVEFNKMVFDNAMDADLPIMWDTKLRSTAGTTTNRLIKTSRGERIRTSSIKLSTKVLDAAQRLRDTLIHEMCHAATWLIDGELRAGHGPVWKKWASRALRKFPELGEISRCHDMEIHYKYCYKCTKCGYSIKRHSKSIDITKRCCGYCRGTFEITVNKKNKDGVITSTPARKAGPNDFALYVKENYGSLKTGKTHAEVMKMLGEQFSARKNKKMCSEENLFDSNSD